jgi:hypothetical protein
MAVVQISKIQIRRGLKNSSTGVPQLSSAEMAWAIDSQELFIGNGSVADGAPYVGNTKILTEHDNILDLASSYRFANNDTSVINSVSRSLQSKLDEYVSIADWGAIGDGITDCTTAFQDALNDLFRNANENYKKVLFIPNGEYIVNSNLRIPSGTIIKGETQSRSIINIGSNSIRLIASNGSEFVDFSSTIRAENIEISNLKIRRTTGTVVLSGIRESTFRNVDFEGNYELGDTVASVASELPAVFWQNPSVGVAANNLYFIECNFINNSVSVSCVQSLVFQTAVEFRRCEFYINHVGIYISGVAGQSNAWTISESRFNQIAEEALRATNGRDTLIRSTEFLNVGNGTGTAQYPISPIVYFGEKINNRVIDSTSNRQQEAGITDVNSTAALIEIENADKAVFIDRVYSPIYLSDSFRPLAVFSAKAKYIQIEYFLQLGSAVKNSRIGQITISVGTDIAGDNVSDVSITDSYQYSPITITSSGGVSMTNLEFNAEVRSNSALDDSTSGPNSETILLTYKNPIATGFTGSVSFQVTYGV